MVVSFKAATCGGTFGWAAFRRHAGRWNLVWRYGNGQRSIAKVGVEIKETLNILRPTDPRPIRELCFVQWIPDLPILPHGQSSEVGDFRCTSAVDGVTCVKRSAPGAGKGFRVSEDEAVEVGP